MLWLSELRHELSSAVYADLVEDLADVLFCSGHFDAQQLANLAVAVPAPDELGDLARGPLRPVLGDSRPCGPDSGHADAGTAPWVFEADFEPDSHGFRPKRGAHDALNAIRGALEAGSMRTLPRIFDMIPHDRRLMKTVAERVVDGAPPQATSL